MRIGVALVEAPQVAHHRRVEVQMFGELDAEGGEGVETWDCSLHDHHNSTTTTILLLATSVSLIPLAPLPDPGSGAFDADDGETDAKEKNADGKHDRKTPSVKCPHLFYDFYPGFRFPASLGVSLYFLRLRFILTIVDFHWSF